MKEIINYQIKQIKDFNNLEQSLKEAGQIEPIIVFIDKNNKEYIVDGKKRSDLLKKLNIKQQKKEFNDLIKLFRFILDSKDITEVTIWKYTHLLNKRGLTENEIYNEVFNQRIKISVRDIWKLLQVNYSPILEKQFTDLQVSLKEIIMYYEFDPKNLEKIMEVFLLLQANKNNRKDIFIFINEILKIKKLSLTNFLELEEIKEILNSELQSNEKINLFKKLLFSLRNPNINQEIENLNVLKNKIKTTGFKLDLPIEKESKRSSISFEFKNYKELEKKINSLNNLLNQEALKELLEKIENR